MNTRATPGAPGRLIAFARGDDSGPILYTEAPFRDEFLAAGWDIEEHDFPPPPRSGLLMFEGWVEVGPGPDPDVHFRGEWRQLTHWEVCRLRWGVSPLGDEEREHYERSMAELAHDSGGGEW